MDLITTKTPGCTNYVSVSLTFRCNLNCPYCINDYTAGEKINSSSGELTGQQWVDGLNRIDLPEDVPFTLEGGEPSLHIGFYEIINNVNHKINILTNLSFNEDKFIDAVDPRKLMKGVKRSFKPIRVSFHALGMDINKTVEKAEKLQESGFGVGIFGIAHPESVEQNIEMAEVCRKHHIYFFIKDYLGHYKGRDFGYYRYPTAISGRLQKCNCIGNEVLIGPNGNLYKCHRDMYAKEFPLGNVLDENLLIEHKIRNCEKYGECNPCDVKMKTNRYLQAGNSSVEITNVEI